MIDEGAIDFEGIDADTLEFYIEEKVAERSIAEKQIELNEINLKISRREGDDMKKALVVETDSTRAAILEDDLEAKQEWQEYIINHSDKLRDAIIKIDAILERLRT